MRVADQALDILLNSKRTKRKQESARKLRDSVVRNWSSGDRTDLRTRYSSLVKTLAGVIDKIQRLVEA